MDESQPIQVIFVVTIDKEATTQKCITGWLSSTMHMDQESFETPVVGQPPYLHMVDFTQFGHGFSNSDLPPSYENCILESQPPSYSVLK